MFPCPLPSLSFLPQGGLTYLILKSTVKLYLRINQYKRLGRRVILDHPENV